MDTSDILALIALCISAVVAAWTVVWSVVTWKSSRPKLIVTVHSRTVIGRLHMPFVDIRAHALNGPVGVRSVDLEASPSVGLSWLTELPDFVAVGTKPLPHPLLPSDNSLQPGESAQWSVVPNFAVDYPPEGRAFAVRAVVTTTSGKKVKSKGEAMIYSRVPMHDDSATRATENWRRETGRKSWDIVD